MRIAQVNLESDFGGAERHVLLLFRGLRDRGLDVCLFCHPDGRLRREAAAVGLTVLPVRARNQIDPGAALRLAAGVRRLRPCPDVLHLHTPRDYLSGTLAARVARVPATVITRHTTSRRVRPILRRVYGRAGAVLCLAPAIRESLRDQGVPAEKLALVYGAIDTTEFAAVSFEDRAAVRGEWGLGDDPAALSDRPAALVVGTVGRLVPGKGHACFLEAVARFGEDSARTTAKFVLVGDGPERPALEALAGRLGLAADRRVVFAGFRPDMPRVMAALDLFVLASDAEVLPLVVMEALAAGRAVVATRVGGVPEIVEDGATGLLVPPGDPDALAAALRRLAEDPGLRARLGEAGRRSVERRFALPRMIEDTVRVYERLCSDAASSNGRG